MKYEKDNNETIVMSKEKLDKYSTSLTSYLYTSLATEAKEEGKSFTQYITTGKSFGNYYYLLYKIDQVEDKVLYEEVENEDDLRIWGIIENQNYRLSWLMEELNIIEKFN